MPFESMPCPLHSQSLPSLRITPLCISFQCHRLSLPSFTSPRPRWSLQCVTLPLPFASAPSRSGLCLRAAVWCGSELCDLSPVLICAGASRYLTTPSQPISHHSNASATLCQATPLLFIASPCRSLRSHGLAHHSGAISSRRDPHPRLAPAKQFTAMPSLRIPVPIGS